MELDPFEPPKTQPLAPQEEKMKFSLSRSNKLFLLAASLQVIIHASTLEASDYAIGATIGIMARLLLVSYLVARLTWWISKNSKAASTAFNASLILLILVQMVSSQIKLDRSVQDKAMKHIENETASYREVAEVSEDSSEIKTAYNNLVKALKAHSQQDPNVAYEKALEFYSVINERHVNVAETLPKWKNAFNAALEAHVLDPSVLTTEEEFASQIKILQAYVDESQLLSSKDSQSYKNFLERMVEISSKNDFAKAAVASWGPDASAEASPLAALATIHIRHAEAMLGMIELLHENFGEWYYEDDELHLPNDSVLEEYNQLSESMAEIRQLIIEAGEDSE